MTLGVAILGYGAAVIGIVSSAYLADRRKIGWIFGLGSSAVFMVYGALEGIDSFVAVNIVSIYISIMGLEKWRSHKKKKHRSHKVKTHKN